MIDFSTNKYIHNIQVKGLHGTYTVHMKNKLFSSKRFVIDKLNQKMTSKMLSLIGLIHIIQPELSKAKAKKLIYLKYG